MPLPHSHICAAVQLAKVSNYDLPFAATAAMVNSHEDSISHLQSQNRPIHPRCEWKQQRACQKRTEELPSVLHEGVASIIRPHLASDPAIREAYLQVGKSYYGEDPLITVTIFVDTEATMLENERAFNWIQSNCDDQGVYFDLWTFNDLDLERLEITGDKLIATGHSLIYARDAS